MVSVSIVCQTVNHIVLSRNHESGKLKSLKKAFGTNWMHKAENRIPYNLQESIELSN